MKATAHVAAHLGLAKTTNEDAHLLDPELGLFIVCDGATHPYGNLASSTTCREVQRSMKAQQALIQRYFDEPTPAIRLQLASALQKAVLEAGNAIHKMILADPSKKGMFTTVEAVLCLKDYALLAHVGDSRTYLMREGTLHRLTVDHTFLMDLVKDGTTSVEEAKRRPFSSDLTRALGVAPFVQVDTLQLELAPKDLLLLCTDGLSDPLSPIEIGTLVGSTQSITEISEAVVATALKKGSNDNITTLLIKLTEVKAAEKSQGVSANVMEKFEVIRSVPIFKHLGYSELIKVLGIVAIKAISKGQAIIEAGKQSDEMFILLQGSVNILAGGEVVAHSGKGAAFGEMGIFDNAPRSATVVASEAATIMVINRKSLFELMRREVTLTLRLQWGLIQELSKKLRTSNEALVDIKSGQKGMEMPFIELESEET